MLTANDIFLLVAAAIVPVLMVIVLRWRRESHGRHVQELAQEEVCEHLKPALDLLLSRGHQIRRAGQRGPDLPFEIHLAPAFDPKALQEELKLAPPVHLSERNVLYCKDDWCELHPVR